MFKEKQVLLEGNARLGSVLMGDTCVCPSQTCPTQSCISWTWVCDWPCAGSHLQHLRGEGWWVTLSRVLQGGNQHGWGLLLGAAGQRQLCVGHSWPVAHTMLHCICHQGSTRLGDLSIQERTQKGGFKGWWKSLGMGGDRWRANRKRNFLRNSLQPCIWNLLGDLHYLALPCWVISGQIQNQPLIES